MSTLVIDNLHTAIDGKPILNGISLTINGGEIHSIMGPNGSGKSTLAYTLMGHPKYEITGGRITLDGVDLTTEKPDTRARAGLFLAFQYPREIPGVSLSGFIQAAYNAQVLAREPETKRLSVFHSKRVVKEQLSALSLKEEFAQRHVNEGFSGGEKKKAEILQMAILKPKIAILDETDSGLDIDALKVVCDSLNRMRRPDLGMLLITHYQRMLGYIQPDFVHVLVDGKIVRSGSKELALELEKTGYETTVAESA